MADTSYCAIRVGEALDHLDEHLVFAWGERVQGAGVTLGGAQSLAMAPMRLLVTAGDSSDSLPRRIVWEADMRSGGPRARLLN
ncbi:hypothetical protein GCM10028820_31320 [Tessaracoccus terricola]